LIRDMEVKTYPVGAPIFHKGDKAEHMFVVLSGKVKIYSRSTSKMRTTFAYLGPGDFFGEMAMMGDGRRVADVVATSPITLFEMFGTHFRELEMILPEVAARIGATLEERRAAL
jgi:CRP/FNR family transcriptional regulator